MMEGFMNAGKVHMRRHNGYYLEDALKSLFQRNYVASMPRSAVFRQLA